MIPTEAVALIVSIIGGVSGVASIIAFATTRRQRHRDEGADKAILSTRLDTISLQNESLLQGNRQISEKLDGQNVRLSRIEQIVEDADIAAIPPKLAALEASVKSAHHRIDTAERTQQ